MHENIHELNFIQSARLEENLVNTLNIPVSVFWVVVPCSVV